MHSVFGEVLDRRARAEWQRLSRLVLNSRASSKSCVTNQDLELALPRTQQTAMSPTYSLWLADNYAHDGLYSQAIRAYDATIERARAMQSLPSRLDTTVNALYSKAKAQELTGDAAAAIETLVNLRHYPAEASAGLLRAGLLAEGSGDHKRAADFYSSFASREPSSNPDDPSEKCRRALERLKDTRTRYFGSARELSAALSEALARREASSLMNLASKTHFAVGAMGSHTTYEDLAFVAELGRELAVSKVMVRPEVFGRNAKIYLQTTGWKGRWFQRDVYFLLTRAPQGWQWTGLGLTTPNDLWMAHWKTQQLQGNPPQQLQGSPPQQLGLLAPWPEGERFMAGGLDVFIAQMAAVQSVGAFGFAMVMMYSGHLCGFGPRGYYYNMWKTHVGAESYAIDFSRYKRWVPFDNIAGGTPVLAAASGIVSRVVNTVESNTSDHGPNRVHIDHADPYNPSHEARYTSRYLHMQGPFQVPVSENMHVATGTRLGLMDDTGTSLFDHLHFVLYDNDLATSVPPSPLNGYRLEDHDSGTCILSTNRERRPMSQITYATNNWLILPSGRAVNEQFASANDQRFVLVQSGVAIVELQGRDSSQWTHETVSIFPSLWDPLSYAVNKWQVPSPPTNYTLEFETEQYAPIVTLSSVWNKDVSVNSGFAVDAWRPSPWRTGTDALTNRPLTSCYAGLQADLAVQDTDAWILRIGYHITLVGRIAYLPLGNV